MIEFEKTIILGYLHNLLNAEGRRPGLVREVCDFFDSHREILEA